MLKYYKNFIFCNDIDYYCLICEEGFVSSEDVQKHIRWEKHRKLMKNQTCLPKFGKDGIYKIMDKLYYCEVCNHIFSTFGAVKTHVSEESHKTNKEKPKNALKEVKAVRKHGWVELPNGNITMFERKVWHGVINKFCVFCDVSVDTFDIHANLPSHLLNFMQSELVKVGKDEKFDVYYRKINDSKYYCFKCKQTVPSENVDMHWKEVHTIKENSERPKMLFVLDIENDMGTCTLCNKPFEGYMQMTTHKQKHIEKKEWPYNEQESNLLFMELEFCDKGKRRHNLKMYGKENFIKLNEGGSKGYCTLCHIIISAHIRNFRQHVGGLHHQSQLQIRGLVPKTNKTEIPKYKTQPLIQYIRNCHLIRNTDMFVASEAEVLIDIISFELITTTGFKNKDKYVCYACDSTFSDSSKHMGNSEHKNKLFKSLVITSIKDEFVREIRSGFYHCGVCNLAFAGYAVLEKHLSLLKHRYNRCVAHRRIEDYVDMSSEESVLSVLIPIGDLLFTGCRMDDVD